MCWMSLGLPSQPPQLWPKSASRSPLPPIRSCPSKCVCRCVLPCVCAYMLRVASRGPAAGTPQDRLRSLFLSADHLRARMMLPITFQSQSPGKNALHGCFEVRCQGIPRGPKHQCYHHGRRHGYQPEPRCWGMFVCSLCEDFFFTRREGSHALCIWGGLPAAS